MLLNLSEPSLFLLFFGSDLALGKYIDWKMKKEKALIEVKWSKDGFDVCVVGVCVGTHLVSRSLRNSMFRDSTKIRPVILYKKRSTPAPHRIRTEKAVIYFLI